MFWPSFTFFRTTVPSLRFSLSTTHSSFLVARRRRKLFGVEVLLFFRPPLGYCAFFGLAFTAPGLLTPHAGIKKSDTTQVSAAAPTKIEPIYTDLLYVQIQLIPGHFALTN